MLGIMFIFYWTKTSKLTRLLPTNSLQRDQRERIVAKLEKLGYQVKKVGGKRHHSKAIENRGQVFSAMGYGNYA